jgi:predicted O-methyltransferase YrrM
MDIWECALGFMDAQILLTAEELGIFNILATGPHTVKEIAAATGLPNDSAQRLLTALCAMKIIRRQPDGLYINGPEAEEQLVCGRPGYIGAMFEHLRGGLYSVWNNLKEALLEGEAQWKKAFRGKPAPIEEMYSDPQALRAFMEGMHTITYEAAVEFATIVDIGGATGAFAIALAQKFPRLRGIVFDLPPVRPIAEDFFHRYGLAARLSFMEGDFFENPIPAGFDAYSLGFILHDWDREGGSFLLRKIAEATRPGGLLIIGEYVLNDNRTGPRYVARSDLNMLVAARGRERTAGEYQEWIKEFGFQLQRIQPTSKGKHFLIAQHR